MHLKSVAIKNFRGLENIQIDFEKGINVIVGPNAIGKTTLLEAIRLGKAVLSPRTQSEPNQALINLGAVVPYDQSKLIFDSIARDPNQAIEIKSRYQLTNGEIDNIQSHLPEIALGLVQANIGQTFGSPSQIISFLSISQGQATLSQANTELQAAHKIIKQNENICRLELIIDPISGSFSNAFPVEAGFLAFLDRTLPPNKTCFSYFPADRALPTGEQPVQIGGGDTAQQVESHNSQPQLKYSRLKNTIFTAVITSDVEQGLLREDFAKIFGGVLKGRQLVDVGVNRHGLLSVLIKDSESGRVFNLDGMSSGEKGLILTFLLVGRTVIEGGIILLDEPELHLNPAVCKDVLGVLLDEYVKPKDLQAIVCSHSAEILAGAFDKEGCTLYHLVSEKNLTRVRYKDREVIAEALRALGTSETEGLLYKGTIFVEGVDDVEVLEVGYPDVLRRYVLKIDQAVKKSKSKLGCCRKQSERRTRSHQVTLSLIEMTSHLV